jgi:D-alanine-D-alanine ligase-like ATP-grasp enzyme
MAHYRLAVGQFESSGTDRINLVIIFGGQSAEHDVSCSTAAHVMKAVNPDRYIVTALGIDRFGQWHLAESAMAALDQGPDAIPARLEASGRAVSSALALTAASAKTAQYNDFLNSSMFLMSEQESWHQRLAWTKPCRKMCSHDTGSPSRIMWLCVTATFLHLGLNTLPLNFTTQSL